MVPARESDLPEPRVLSYYRTGIGRNGADPATMVDTPAIVAGDFGHGRVLLFSPHPEKTNGLESLIQRGIAWQTGASPEREPTSEASPPTVR